MGIRKKEREMETGIRTHETGNRRFWWVAVSLGVTVLTNQAAYRLGRAIAGGRIHLDFTSPLDLAIPFAPWTVSIYFGCFLFWAAAYLLIFCQEERESVRFFRANLMANGVCFLAFVLLPTTNVRPVFAASTVWERLVLFLYRVDAPDNLFPSVHCMVSWFCWAGVRGRRTFPPLWRAFSCFMAAAVCVSTLTTRQHVVMDVAGGILLCEGTYWLAGQFSSPAWRTARPMAEAGMPRQREEQELAVH